MERGGMVVGWDCCVADGFGALLQEGGRGEKLQAVPFFVTVQYCTRKLGTDIESFGCEYPDSSSSLSPSSTAQLLGPRRRRRADQMEFILYAIKWA